MPYYFFPPFFSSLKNLLTLSVRPDINVLSVTKFIAFLANNSSSTFSPLIHTIPFCPTVILQFVSSLINFIILPSLPITLGTLFGLILTIIPPSSLPRPLPSSVKSTPFDFTFVILALKKSLISKKSDKLFLSIYLGTSDNGKNADIAESISVNHPLNVISFTLPIITFPLLGINTPDKGIIFISFPFLSDNP